ncbi:hypothetical protein XELAEV_18016988mg [Xenopus laevis]|uniref:CCHC-type domain-containing protein n=1 Tax=Xenopus laevis TaxID=8355 RepID=A0A974DAB8_XENLA|nr:hypothetical protein XELAEV_18016988mg [Xenopus laevis]
MQPTDPGFHENMSKGIQRYKEKKAEIATLKTLIKNKRHACAKAYSLARPKKRVEIAALCDKLHSLEQEVETLGNRIGPVKESFDNAERFRQMDQRRQEEKYKASLKSRAIKEVSSDEEPHSSVALQPYQPAPRSPGSPLLHPLVPPLLHLQNQPVSLGVSQAASQAGGTAAAAENVGVQPAPAVLAAWAQKPNANVAAAENSGNDRAGSDNHIKENSQCKGAVAGQQEDQKDQKRKRMAKKKTKKATKAAFWKEKKDSKVDSCSSAIPDVAVSGGASVRGSYCSEEEISERMPEVSAGECTEKTKSVGASVNVSGGKVLGGQAVQVSHVSVQEVSVGVSTSALGAGEANVAVVDVSTASGSGQSFANVVRGRESGGVKGVRQKNVAMTGVCVGRGDQPAEVQVPRRGRVYPSDFGCRKNVVRLQWEREGPLPDGNIIIDKICDMGFSANDLYCFVHNKVFKDYSVSFMRRKVWLKRYGDVIVGEGFWYRGIWTGSWQAKVPLRTVGNVPQHIPSSSYIGRELVCCFYHGQPRECWKCGSTRHFSISCDVLKCAMCLGVGHVAKHCPKSIRCNLCGVLGHAYGSCPMLWQSIDEEFRMEAVEPESEAPLGQVVAMTPLVPDPDPIIPHNPSQRPKTPQPSQTPQPPTSFRHTRGRGRGRGQPRGGDPPSELPSVALSIVKNPLGDCVKAGKPLKSAETKKKAYKTVSGGNHRKKGLPHYIGGERVESEEQVFAEEEQRVSRDLASSCNADSSSEFENIDPAEAEKIPFGISAKRECSVDDRKAKRRAETSSS